MNFVDILIIIFIILSIVRGFEIGFVRQLLSTFGFFGGLLLGALLVPHLMGLMHSQLSRALTTIIITLGLALVLLTVGEILGVHLKKTLLKLKTSLLNRLDNGLGSLIAVVSLIIMIWLSAAVLTTLPYPKLQSSIRGSSLISFINSQVPNAPNIIAKLGRIIDPNGFPEVFSGLEPAPKNAPLPTPAELAIAVNRDEASVVKIEGQGCGGVVVGSGFVVANDLVVTNAHVVAGIKTPFVSDNNGTHKSIVIHFDPSLDIAVLRVGNLAGKPLNFVSSDPINGTKGGVFGYPGGGAFSAERAVILDKFTAVGKNIYNKGSTTREVFSVKSHIVPGNSGGPLVDLDGNVLGVVFAESTSYNNVGYALTVNQVVSAINDAKTHGHPVNTGGCAS